MQGRVFPTKGNLIKTKKSFDLAKLGYELLDRKRTILIAEMMKLIETAKSIRGEIEQKYKDAYLALQKANITLGLCNNIAKTAPIDESISIVYHSVMGVDIPNVKSKKKEGELDIFYGFSESNSQLDNAYLSFEKAKQLTIILAEIDNSVYRLADAIKKTQIRANALKNIIIPNFAKNIKFISDSLEEKEREDFSSLKVIKFNKEKKNLDN